MVIFFSRGEEITPKKKQISFNSLGKKIIKDVFSNKKNITEDGKLIRDSINQGVNFNPDLIFEQLVKNYSMAEKIYGKSIIRKLANYNPNYIEKNISIPEFQKELKEVIDNNVEKLKEKGLLNDDNSISEKGLELASLILYKDELDNIMPRGIFGEKIHKKHFIYGDKQDIKAYKKQDRYRDIAIKKSVKLAIRRKHKSLQKNDLKSFERQSKGSINIIYALDASGSMKGDKIDTCKKAGIALAYKAIDEKDKVGLVVFNSEIKTSIPPTDDFITLLKEITKIRALKETNIALTIKKSIELFPATDSTKHLILITDAMPTIDKEDTLEAASLARSNNITISLVGVKLNDKAKKLAEKLTNIGEGNLYIVKDLKELDKIVLEDYYSVA